MSAPQGRLAHKVAAIPIAAVGPLTPMPTGAVAAFFSVFAVSDRLRLPSFQPTSRATHTATARTTVPPDEVT